MPAIPNLLQQKLTKTGYTRGATVREIYQNRVTRNSTVLIDHDYWDKCRPGAEGMPAAYENGFIVLVQPRWYFSPSGGDEALAGEGLALAENALLLYQNRDTWRFFSPTDHHLMPGKQRLAPLGGRYIARIHATVAANDGMSIVSGYDTTAMRGAGIRVYEYASTQTIVQARLQLECLFWRCFDSIESAVAEGMSQSDAVARRDVQFASAEAQGLLDDPRLRTARMVDAEGVTVCPLCLKQMSGADLMRRTAQAEGRTTYDLTTTEASLFHIEELRVGSLQHKPYNLGWGHHHCNVVVKDAGIGPTVTWMRALVAANDTYDELLQGQL